MPLSFKKVTSEKEIKEIYNFNVQAFSDTPDVDWTLNYLKTEASEGWEIFGVKEKNGSEIVAVAFLKEEAKSLLTKNTGIKMLFQGNGYSHQIKDFYEKEARSRGLNSIFNYCRKDNFRMMNLNNSHGYVQTNKETNGIVEWEKALK